MMKRTVRLESVVANVVITAKTQQIVRESYGPICRTRPSPPVVYKLKAGVIRKQTVLAPIEQSTELRVLRI